MNPPKFIGSNINLDPEELQQVFEVMRVADAEGVELASYHLKGVATIWYDQWKKNRADAAQPMSWAVFDNSFLCVQEYNLKFTKLSRYAKETVANMTSTMSLFMSRLSHLSSKEGKAAMLIGDMDIARLMIYVCQVKEDKLNDREEFHSASLTFVTPYVAMRSDILPECFLAPFSVSTPIGTSILLERVYRDCTISVNHKDTVVDLDELDMVDFDVILGMD
ncbi:hypothetical protein MTR67_002144 [Solanum verrucosum]|uniref:Gag-pol polyprotein n=1 Tax=Solanum verrucosum TaxID=315347 RepID=A0AAF0PPI6_SOLVR|nr:hypothetical protein MTR67_002144 [Solanum verrucosum]